MSKHRRLELKHFCLQYYEWVDEVRSLSYLPHLARAKSNRLDISDPVVRLVEKREIYLNRIAVVNEAVSRLNDPIGRYIFDAVTKDRAFPYYETHGIPCSRDTFYDRYRKFFWILDKIRE